MFLANDNGLFKSMLTDFCYTFSYFSHQSISSPIVLLLALSSIITTVNANITAAIANRLCGVLVSVNG